MALHDDRLAEVSAVATSTGDVPALDALTSEPHPSRRRNRLLSPNENVFHVSCTALAAAGGRCRRAFFQDTSFGFT